MKIIRLISATILIPLVTFWSVFIYPLTALADDGVENFDSYSDESNLVGQNGGSGWAEAWQDSDDADDWTAETTGCQAGAACIEYTSGTEAGKDTRDFATGITNGVLTIYGSKSDNDNNLVIDLIKANDGTVMCLGIWERSGLGSDFNLICASNTDIGNITADTFEQFEIEWGDTGGTGTCAANEARARFNGGTFSACDSFASAQTGAIEGIDIRVDQPTTGGKFDSIVITDSDAVAAAAVDFSNFHVNLGWTEF